MLGSGDQWTPTPFGMGSRGLDHALIPQAEPKVSFWTSFFKRLNPFRRFGARVAPIERDFTKLYEVGNILQPENGIPEFIYLGDKQFGVEPGKLLLRIQDEEVQEAALKYLKEKRADLSPEAQRLLDGNLDGNKRNELMERFFRDRSLMVGFLQHYKILSSDYTFNKENYDREPPNGPPFSIYMMKQDYYDPGEKGVVRPPDERLASTGFIKAISKIPIIGSLVLRFYASRFGRSRDSDEESINAMLEAMASEVLKVSGTKQVHEQGLYQGVYANGKVKFVTITKLVKGMQDFDNAKRKPIFTAWEKFQNFFRGLVGAPLLKPKKTIDTSALKSGDFSLEEVAEDALFIAGSKGSFYNVVCRKLNGILVSCYNLGAQLVDMIRANDPDCNGSHGQNKGILIKTGELLVFDTGQALRTANKIIATLDRHFRFKKPKKKFENYGIYYDSTLKDHMKGIYRLARLRRGTMPPDSLLALYGPGFKEELLAITPAADLEAINRYRAALLKKRDATQDPKQIAFYQKGLLELIAAEERLKVDEQLLAKFSIENPIVQMGPCGMELSDNLRKLCSQTSSFTNHSKKHARVHLQHLRVIEKDEIDWDFKVSQDGNSYELVCVSGDKKTPLALVMNFIHTQGALPAGVEVDNAQGKITIPAGQLPAMLELFRESKISQYKGQALYNEVELIQEETRLIEACNLAPNALARDLQLYREQIFTRQIHRYQSSLTTLSRTTSPSREPSIEMVPPASSKTMRDTTSVRATGDVRPKVHAATSIAPGGLFSPPATVAPSETEWINLHSMLNRQYSQHADFFRTSKTECELLKHDGETEGIRVSVTPGTRSTGRASSYSYEVIFDAHKALEFHTKVPPGADQEAIWQQACVLMTAFIEQSKITGFNDLDIVTTDKSLATALYALATAVRAEDLSIPKLIHDLHPNAAVNLGKAKSLAEAAGMFAQEYLKPAAQKKAPVPLYPAPIY